MPGEGAHGQPALETLGAPPKKWLSAIRTWRNRTVGGSSRIVPLAWGARRWGSGARTHKGLARTWCGFGLLSGMFSNLHRREEVCQRKYVTDCK